MNYFKPLPRKLSVVTLGMVCVLVIICLLDRHDARYALPATATNIHLYRSPSYGLTGDYVDLLKSAVTEDEFQVFVDRLKLSPLKTTADRFNGRFRMFASAPSWWNPCDLVDGAYYDAQSKGSRIVLAKYEGGNVYYMESCGY